MCGIVGLFSKDGMKNWQQKRAFMEQALVADTFRGVDSTGLFAVKHDKNIRVIKKAMPGWDFVQMKPVDSILGSPENYKFIVGHNRQATKGSVIARNAHPFQHEHIIGVHNGTLWNHRQLKGCNDIEVDSDAIYHSMAHNGEVETIAELDGAFALVWYNSNTDTLNMLRNDERPLYFATVKNMNTILVASEGDMLKWLAGRNQLEIDKLMFLKPGVIVSVKGDDLSISVKEVKLKEKKEVVSNNNYQIYQQEAKMLSDMGYKVGEKILVTVDEYVPYRGSPLWGDLWATTLHDPYSIVCMKGFERSKWEKLKKTGTYRCTITGARYEQNLPTLFANAITLEEVEKKQENSKVLCIHCQAPTDKTYVVNGGRDYVCKDCARQFSLTH